MSCWVAMSSSSEGAIEVLSEVGRDIVWGEFGVMVIINDDDGSRSRIIISST